MRKLKPYSEVLKMSKEEIKELMIPIRAKQTKKQIELKLYEIEEEIMRNEANVQNICSRYPLEIEHLIDAQDTLALMDRKHKKLQQMLDELFPA
jgi:hypothetical protein